MVHARMKHLRYRQTEITGALLETLTRLDSIILKCVKCSCLRIWRIPFNEDVEDEDVAGTTPREHKNDFSNTWHTWIFQNFEIAKSHDQDLDSREDHVTDEMESIKVRSGQRRLD